MEDISDIKIIGMDEKNPPKVLKEPYIDLCFKLSHQAPEDWCEDFNIAAKKMVPPASIVKTKGLIIVTYVRKMDDIVAQMEQVKKQVKMCNDRYLENIRRREAIEASKNVNLGDEGGEQGKLNAIIAALDFDS